MSVTALVIRMDAGSRGRKHQSCFVEPDQACNRDTRLDRIANQSVAKRQGVPIDTKDGGGASRLGCAPAAFTVSRWFTVAQVDEENRSIVPWRRASPLFHP
jgi:hypothetical protein